MPFQSIIESIKRLQEDEVEKEKVKGHWFILSGSGEMPSPRLGHTCTWVPPHREHDDCRPCYGRVYCIGGANPEQTFEDTYLFDLNKSIWSTCKAPGLIPRYEHAAFAIQSPDSKIYIFGGSNEHGNLNDVQQYDVITRGWKDILPHNCDVPSPRTHHAMAVVNRNKLVIYGGGHRSSSPVQDTRVHIYNSDSCCWASPDIAGEPPEARQGHFMTSVNNKIYLHGGMSGDKFFDDTFELDLDESKWTTLKCNSPSPSGRAGHGGIGIEPKCFIIFGGLTSKGVCNDLYLFNTDSHIWTNVVCDGCVPLPRLDFAVCDIPLFILEENHKCSASQTSVDSTKICDYLMFLHGGMNVDGDIFGDAFLFYLKTSASDF